VQTVISCPHSKVSSGYLADVHSRDVVRANLPENTGLSTSSNIGNPRGWFGEESLLKIAAAYNFCVIVYNFCVI